MRQLPHALVLADFAGEHPPHPGHQLVDPIGLVEKGQCQNPAAVGDFGFNDAASLGLHHAFFGRQYLGHNRDIRIDLEFGERRQFAEPGIPTRVMGEKVADRFEPETFTQGRRAAAADGGTQLHIEGVDVERHDHPPRLSAATDTWPPFG